jgi:hypothetical protein
MQKNVGNLDRNIRIGFGVALLLINIAAPVAPHWHIAMVVVALIAFITAYTGL